MKAPEEKFLIAGPAGQIEVIMERPDAPRGIALIAQLAGEMLTRASGLPLPGPVLGLALMLT